MKNLIIITAILGSIYRIFFFLPERDHGTFTGSLNPSLPTLNQQKIIGNVKIFTKKSAYTGGQGFVIRHRSKILIATAAHLFVQKFHLFGDPMSKVDGVELINQSTKKVIISGLKPVKGPSYSVAKKVDARYDIALFKGININPDSGFQLGLVPARKHQRLWLYCGNGGDVSSLEFWQLTVTKSTNYALRYQFDRSISFKGTSGCPVLNSNLEVVGINVFGSGNWGVAVPLSGVKRSFEAITR